MRHRQVEFRASSAWAGAALGLLALASSGCIDPIDLDVGEPDRMLVVEARLTDGPGPHYVRLTRTGAFTQGLDAIRPAERGAHVFVEADDGTVYVFDEVSAGRYESAPGELIGEVGRAYTLQIELLDGTVYRSASETMLPASEIAALHLAVEDGFRVINGVLLQDPRVTAYVDVETNPAETKYYRWTLDGTYEVMTITPQGAPRTCFRPLVHHSPGQVDSDVLAGGSIFRRNAGTLPMSSHSLAFRFALHLIVEQQALSPDAYHYWSRIHALRYNVGSLFDPPPEATFGNVANVADPTDRALGYFTVGALVTSETCVSQHDFDEFPPLGRPLVLFGVCGETISGSLVPPPDFVQACRNR